MTAPTPSPSHPVAPLPERLRIARGGNNVTGFCLDERGFGRWAFSVEHSAIAAEIVRRYNEAPTLASSLADLTKRHEVLVSAARGILEWGAWQAVDGHFPEADALRRALSAEEGVAK